MLALPQNGEHGRRTQADHRAGGDGLRGPAGDPGRARRDRERPTGHGGHGGGVADVDRSRCRVSSIDYGRPGNAFLVAFAPAIETSLTIAFGFQRQACPVSELFRARPSRNRRRDPARGRERRALRSSRAAGSGRGGRDHKFAATGEPI